MSGSTAAASHDSFDWTQCYVSFGDPDGEDFAFTKCDANGTFTLTGLPDGQLAGDGVRPVERHAGRRPVDAGRPRRGQPSRARARIQPATSTWATSPTTSGRPTSTPAPSSTTTRTASRKRPRPEFRSSVPRSAIATAASPTTSAPTSPAPPISTDVPAVQLVRGRDRRHPLQEHRHPRGLRLRRSGRRHASLRQTAIERLSAMRHLTIGQIPGEHRGTGLAADESARAGRGLLRRRRLHGQIDRERRSDQRAIPSNCTANVRSGSDQLPAPPCCRPAASIRPGSAASRAGRAFPDRTTSSNSARSPTSPGENGGIKGHVDLRLDPAVRRSAACWCRRSGSRWFRTSPSTCTRRARRRTASLRRSHWSTPRRPAAGMIGRRASVADGMSQHELPGPDRPPTCSSSRCSTSRSISTVYNAQHGGRADATLPYNSQYKCYDGMHNWNQLQPAPYDGMYKFPSVTAHGPDDRQADRQPTARSACRITSSTRPICTTALPQLPAGKYVVEVVLPPGYEIVKEEDKNILIGDNYIAPATQEFGGLGDIFILPDQARSRGLRGGYNANNAQNPTQSLGAASEQRHRPRLRARADLAVRRPVAHRAGLHQPLPAVARRSRRSPARPATSAIARK